MNPTDDQIQEIIDWERKSCVNKDNPDSNSHVYAIHFSTVGVLKIGSAFSPSAIFSAKKALLIKGYPEPLIRNGREIWHISGGKIAETWIQVHLAVHVYPTLFGASSTRISEWFLSDRDTDDQIRSKLNYFYSLLPKGRSYPVNILTAWAE